MESTHSTTIYPGIRMSSSYTFDDHVTEVLSRYEDTTDPRLREIMTNLTTHLLSFANEVQLTREEWMTGLSFLTDTGKKADEVRLEMMLLSDLLGLSALIDIIEHDETSAATDATLLGPFYVPDAPERAFGEENTSFEDPSERLTVRGTVTSTEGATIENASIEIWQNGHDGLYTVQALDRFPMEHLRGTYRSQADGSYEIKCLRPVDYPVPMDGPPGDMLRATGREGMRAAHLHFLVTAPGHRPLITEIFDTQSARLQTDVVFGVRPSLVRTPTAGEDGVSETTFDLIMLPA